MTGPPSHLIQGGIVVLSGPSGSGKTSICRALLEDPRVILSVSATTRSPRPGEKDGVDYHFYSLEAFERLREQGMLVEWAKVYHNYYGTPKAPLLEAMHWSDRILLLDIDVQGAGQLRRQKIPARFLFVAPPSIEVLRQRLMNRGSDPEEVIERRLKFAIEEMSQQHLYDHVLVNQDLEATIAEVRAQLGLDPA